jgi:hypothetical protein
MPPRSPLHRARRSSGAHGSVAASGGTWCSARLRVSPPGGRGMAGRNGHLARSFLDVAQPRCLPRASRCCLAGASVGALAGVRLGCWPKPWGWTARPGALARQLGSVGAGGEGGGSVGQVQDAGDDLAASGGCCTCQVVAGDSASTSRAAVGVWVRVARGP